jgi:hypothetical protein
MTGSWKTRKTKTRFPFVSHSPWKSPRDSHIPTAPAVCVPQNQNSRKETLAAERFTPRLQAHSSMRKCSVRWAEDEADLMAAVLRSQIELRSWAEFVSTARRRQRPFCMR